MMNESRKSIARSLVHAAESFVGTIAPRFQWLEGGDEALVLRAESVYGPIVLHVSPPWRTRAELVWAHAAARHARTHVPEVVAPIEHRAGTVFEWRGRPVAAFPFIAGEMLETDDPRLRADAARLLAAIHTTLQDFAGGPRPEPDGDRPVARADPAALHDPALDAWWMSASSAGFTVGPTHGDYYRRNLLCANGRIVGVIDWHDASVRPLALELAGATFELCRNDEHVLSYDRAHEFVAAYCAAGGPISTREIEMMLPLIRVWLRDDVRSSLAYGARVDHPYVVKQMRAFGKLATSEWRALGDRR
jgi:Ser/Thr protein kinase RdoA (MazF antagonist)